MVQMEIDENRNPASGTSAIEVQKIDLVASGEIRIIVDRLVHRHNILDAGTSKIHKLIVSDPSTYVET